MQGKGKRLSEIFLTVTKILLQRGFPRFDLKVMLLTHRKWRSSSQPQLKNFMIFIKTQYNEANRLIERQILP